MNKQELLRKYLQDQCSHQELQRLYAYLIEDSEEEYKEILYEVWLKLDTKRTIDEETTERMFGKIKADIGHIPDEKVGEPAVPLHKGSRKYPYLSAAAVVTGILVGAALLYRVFLYAPLITADTAYGETNVVTLPDGSVVHLYANSTLRYSGDWSSINHREVWLEGEAFFEVEKKLQQNIQKHKKFTVHTSVLDVEVLGTEFNVKDRRGEIQVVLNSGQIKLKTLRDEGEYLMEPGDLVHAGPLKELEIKKVMEPNLYSLWKKNELYFEDQSLKEIAQELKDSHGIVLQFENQEIANLVFTGSTPVDNLQVLFTSIQKSFDLEMSQNKNEMIFTNKK